MTATAEWPGTCQVSPDEAVAALEASRPKRALSAEERIETALHYLTGQDGDSWPLVRILAHTLLTDDEVELRWADYRGSVRKCDVMAVRGRPAAEQKAAQDADEAVTVLARGAR